MRSEDLINKIKKILDMSSDKALINNTYVSPTYADRIAYKVEELNELGFNLTKTETETSEGTIVTGRIAAPTGNRLELGSLLYDGKSVKVQKSLVTVDAFLTFIEDNIPKQF